MANVSIRGLNPKFGPVPYGNCVVFNYTLETDATGKATNSDATGPLALGDKVTLGYLPEGIVIYDAKIVVSTGFTASVTAKVGFEYVDGVDATALPQNDAAFGTGLALSAAAVLRQATTAPPKALPKEARLILTTAGAANAKAARVDVILFGELLGPL